MLSVGLIIGSKTLWEELTNSLQELSVRTVFELPEIPDDWPSFLDRIDRVRPDVIILETTRLREPLEEVIRNIRSTATQPGVFAVHAAAEPEGILTALRAGAAEYLFPPLARPLAAALDRWSQNRPVAREQRVRGGKVLAFLGAKGGCGTTTLACHVASELPQQTQGKVLLADLDLQSGMVGFIVKAKSTYSVADAANNLRRLDQSYWKGIISNGIPDLEVITAPTEPAGKQVSASQLRQVIAFARSNYDWIVLDLGRNLNSSTLEILEVADQTCVVTTPEVPALHQTKQILQYLLDGGYDRASLRIIVNRMPKRQELTEEEFGKLLGHPIFSTVTNDYQAIQDAYTNGRLVEPGSSLGGRFADLAAKLAGVEWRSKRKRFALFG